MPHPTTNRPGFATPDNRHGTTFDLDFH